jgi:long-chain acyl-CoA synthetase
MQNREEPHMMKQNYVEFLEGSIHDNWKLPAFSNYKADTLSYGEVAERIYRLHALFKAMGLKRGDKVSLLGRNSSAWATAYLATQTYGAVIVPILPDFHPADIETIVGHSDSRLFFTTGAYYGKLDPAKLSGLKAVISLEDGSLLSGDRKALAKAEGLFEAEYKPRLSPEAFGFETVSNEELAAIVYTSGTTGFSKGVMLNHNIFISNVVYSQKNVHLFPGDTILSFLPLAHMFGCAFEFVFPFTRGCHITFLSKVPSTSVLIEAFSEIKPRLVLTVPLVIEKIYYKQVRPMLSTPKMQTLLKIPGIRNIVYGKVRDKLHNFFGGNVIQVIIGGASFNSEVENFLKRIKFRYTIGYGMTECGPLICYVGWKEHRRQSVGHLVDGMEIKIEPVAGSEHGEICVRGENVMQGYYKNPDETAKALDREGWLHTGDLGSLDQDGFVFIRGRSKTMILNSSGQNIYPEEIEAKLNNLPIVAESLVLENNGKLWALVFPDLAEAKKAGIPEESILEKMEENRLALNKELPEYSKIARIELQREEFQKTPTNKIKRFLYAVKG